MHTEKDDQGLSRGLKQAFKLRGFWESLILSWKGIHYLFFYHRNMRIIFLAGLAAALAGIYLKLKGIELVILCATITLVFMAEMFNTAIEILMDILTVQYHVKIKLVKDIAAAVVLIACLNAIAVGYILFAKKLFP